MIFTKIRLENILAYYGSQEIDLTGCTEKKNLILISGRNGTGKTSLLNAVKLLFLGATHESLRRVGYPPQLLGQNQFVLGEPDLWLGLINKQARREGINRASVSVIWREESGVELEAKRTWKINGPSFDEDLEIFENGAALLPEWVSFLLANKLPQDFVPFFFFDGEQIRELAEAEQLHTTHEIERILNLSFLGEIEQGVREYIRQKKRDALPADVRAKLTQAEGELATSEAKRDAARDRLKKSEDAVAEAETRRHQLTIKRDELSSGVSEADRKVIKARLSTLNEQIASLARKISEELPPESPFIVNLGLAVDVFDELGKLLEVRAVQNTETIETLRRYLPYRLIDSEPHPDLPLHPSQADHLRNKLRYLLDSYRKQQDDDQTPVYLKGMDSWVAQTARERYSIWAQEGGRRRDALGIDLKHMRKLTAQAAEASEQLAQISVISESHLQRYREITEALEEVDNEIGTEYENIGSAKTSIADAERTITALSEVIAKLEREHDNAVTASQIVSFSRRVEATLREYRASQRESKRTSVEARINEKLGFLLSNHGQIAKVKLGDQFNMTFVDNEDEPIGRASISSGMKQLVATSLLWALKDEANKQVPIIIDTPLARFDMQNRQRILESYYPNAGNQVIVLPTDSEIDDRQMVALSEHVVRRYHIENVDGENAQFVSDDFDW